MKYIQHIKFSVTTVVGDKEEKSIMSTLGFGEDALDACLKKFFDEIGDSGSIIVYDDSITRDEHSYELTLKNTEIKDERYAEAKVKLELMYVMEMKVGE